MKKLLLSAGMALAITTTSAFCAQTLATVNDKAVTDEDVALFLRSVPNVDFGMLKPEGKQKVLEQVIEKSLLADEAKKSGIENAPEFKDELEKIKGELALDVWMKKEFEKVTVTDEDAKKYYDANPDKSKQPQLYNARHILVKTEADAKKIAKELGAHKDGLEKAFMEAAKNNSIDANKENGGSLGWFTDGTMVKEFTDAVKKMKKGEVSKAPVKTQFGYHLIYLVDEKAPTKVTFDQAKEQIKQMLKVDKFKESMSAKGKSLRDKAKIEYKK
jgi:peptidyl-prolyl cis-trans isomerase C